MKRHIKKLLMKLYRDNSLEKKEIITVLKNLDKDGKKLLLELADKTRLKYYGRKVFLRGIVEFSSYCKNTCMYCGLNSTNKKAMRYRLSFQQIIKCCENGYRLGYRTFVLQSGEDSFFNDDILISLANKIKKSFENTALTFSIGERSRDSYRKLFDAGADRYLLRHETANRNLYSRLHPGMSFENRIECLYTLKELGYQTGAGFIVGLPWQDEEIIAEDILFLKKLQPEMVGTGPFIAHPDTPLRDNENGKVEKTLICLALIRLFLPDVLLPATTALAVLDPKGWSKGLAAGANVIMANLTTCDAREKYEIYKNKARATDNAELCTENIKRSIINSGYEVCVGRGDHLSYSKQAPHIDLYYSMHRAKREL